MVRTYRFMLIAVALVAAVACSKEKNETADEGRRGLPPQTGHELPKAVPAQISGTRRAAADPHAGVGGAAAVDPHGGAPADPHGAMGAPADPHGGRAAADPHAGMGGVSPTPAVVDPNMFLRGTIAGTKKTAPLVKKGDILFLSVKPINPATGEVIGATIAVQRIDVKALPVAFELTAAHMMMAGTKFEGDVVIMARVDHDREARTKQPGDIEGSVKAKIPAKGLKLVLDNVIKTPSAR